MSDSFDNTDNFDEALDETSAQGIVFNEEMVKHSHLNTMYRSWFLDYASYVILERAVPHLHDGLKPVQRRILHTMNKIEDGRYNKVANIIGATMSYHPHGDASIGDALVQLGQKELLIDTQGNWGNILTGDSAAAPRYIEARLTKFALDVLFNPKTTVWKLSYDGRNEEPVTLPVKFPLLLAQGVEGIAVGLASKILPHNFNELLDASVAYLKNEPFQLFPDFPTGGTIDVSKYNDGLRGGVVKVRAVIEKRDAKTLAITQIPYGKTTSSLIDSILKVNDKKIKIKKIDDNTSAEAEIVLHLPPGSSPDKTIDALYAFTDCEMSISPNACVICDNKPHFMPVTEMLRLNTDRTVDLLRQELQIHLDELEKQWHLLSLEKIFIEERIYKDPEFEQSKSNDEVCIHIDNRLTPYYPRFRQAVTKDDILHLLEIKMARILRFNSDAADEKLLAIEEEIRQTQHDIGNIIDYSIAYFKRIKRQYGKDFQRKTEIRSFENIEAAKVVVKNEKLYIDRENGFMGYGLKKGEYISDCSDIDDVIIFYDSGTYIIKKIEEKVDIGQGVIHIAVWKKNDSRTIYNAVYRDGINGPVFAKRFSVVGITRDKSYDITAGTERSKLFYFSANPNGEGEILKVLLKPKHKLRNVVFDFNIGEIAVKGRASRGNLVTKHDVHKIVLKQKGVSTLGGRQIWFEQETLRLNTDARGELLGEFSNNDMILVVNNRGELFTTNTDLQQHFDDNIFKIEKFNSSKLWTAIYFDGETKSYYLKRFRITPIKITNFISEAKNSKLVMLSDEDHARFEATFGGNDKWRGKLEIDADEFIAEKGIKAKGKRISTFEISKFKELEPLIPTVREALTEEVLEEDQDPDDESKLF